MLAAIAKWSPLRSSLSFLRCSSLRKTEIASADTHPASILGEDIQVNSSKNSVYPKPIQPHEVKTFSYKLSRSFHARP